MKEEQLHEMKDEIIVRGEVFTLLKSRYYRHSAPIFGIDYYKPDDRGEDDFSRKQTWFYVYGDEEIKKEFNYRLSQLFKRRFEDDDLEWDFATLYPTHVKDEVNGNMRELVDDVARETGIGFKQVLRRNHTIKENHDLKDVKSKVVNLEGSIDVGDVEGKNVILVDNISLTGVSMLHGVNQLKRAGAENVVSVCLGISSDHGEACFRPEVKLKASEILEEALD